MALYRRGDTWWYAFIFAGKRVQESAKTTRKTVAVEAERNRRLELERTLAGMPAENRMDRIRSVADLAQAYLEHYELNHREQTVLFAKGRLAHIKRLLGGVLLPDLTELVIKDYIKTRIGEGVSGRTVNMELGELSRAIGKPGPNSGQRCGNWRSERTPGARCLPRRSVLCWMRRRRTTRPTARKFWRRSFVFHC